MARNNTPPEAWEQERVFDWIRGNEGKYPQLQLAYSTLNGVKLSPGLSMKMKRQGNRKGVPDIVLPARSGSGEYSGLYLELKRVKGGRVSKEQKEYIARLKQENYCAGVVKGHREAIDTIKHYLAV